MMPGRSTTCVVPFGARSPPHQRLKSATHCLLQSCQSAAGVSALRKPTGVIRAKSPSVRSIRPDRLIPMNPRENYGECTLLQPWREVERNRNT
jgi:hypothetical protein